MSDLVVDSCVIAKAILPEEDSELVHALFARTLEAGGSLIVLDLAFAEVANAIWKRLRQQLVTTEEASAMLTALERMPVRVEQATRLLKPAFEIAARYDRSIYDALFVALAHERNITGVTADTPLFNSVREHYPQIKLLSAT